MAKTNFEIIKDLLPHIARAKLNASAYAVFIYLIWQQFGFPDKDGDNVGYGRLARELKFARMTVIASIRDLITRNMLTKVLKSLEKNNRLLQRLL